MPDDVAVLQARAAAAEAAAKVLEAERAAEVAAQPPVTPAAPVAPAPSPEIPAAVPPAAVGAATPAPGQLPEGILSLEELQRQEQAGGSYEAGMSHAERMRANEQFCASAEWHARNGAS